MSKIVPFILGLSLIVKVEAAIPKNVNPQSSECYDEGKVYTFKMPVGWQVQNDFMGLDIFAAAPSTNKEQISKANVSIVSGPLKEKMNLEEFFKSNLETLQKKLYDFKIVETGKAAFFGFNGKKIIYDYQLNGCQKL